MRTKPAAKAENTSEKDDKTPVSDAKTTETGTTTATTTEVGEKVKKLVGSVVDAATGEDVPSKISGKQVKVKFLRSHPAFGYFAGQEGEISQDDFDKYSKDGEFFEKL